METLNTEKTGSGKPLVLVHGLGSSIRNWDPVVPLLSITTLTDALTRARA